MSSDPESKLPLPVEVTDLAIRKNPSIATHAVVEFVTAANPIRVFLTKQQLQKLSKDARVAAAKLIDP
jgi:hypothetical protein